MLNKISLHLLIAGAMRTGIKRIWLHQQTDGSQVLLDFYQIPLTALHCTASQHTFLQQKPKHPFLYRAHPSQMNWQNKIQIDPPAIIHLLPMSTENRSDTWSQELEKKCAECVSTSYYFAGYCWQWGGTPARAAAFIRTFLTGIKLRSQKLEKISVLSKFSSVIIILPVIAGNEVGRRRP